MKKFNNGIHRTKHESGFYEQLTDQKRTKGKNISRMPAVQYMTAKNNYLRVGNNDEEDEPTSNSTNNRSKYKSMITKSPGQQKQYLRQQPPQLHIEEIDSSDEEVAQTMLSKQEQRAAKIEKNNENSRDDMDYDDHDQQSEPPVIDLDSDSEPETNEHDQEEEEDEDANNNVVQTNERVESTSSDIVITSCDYTLYNKDLEEISTIQSNGKI